jgi:hypothetical protein
MAIPVFDTNAPASMSTGIELANGACGQFEAGYFHHWKG